MAVSTSGLRIAEIQTKAVLVAVLLVAKRAGSVRKSSARSIKKHQKTREKSGEVDVS